MKTGRTLSELAAEIERQQGAKRDLLASTRDIMLTGDLKTKAITMEIGDGNEFGINELTHDQIGMHTKIPSEYYDRMRKEVPSLLAANVNAWFEHNPAKRLVRTMDGNARAFLSDAYRPLENMDLAQAVLPVFADLKLEVVSCEITERRLYLKAVDERINRDIPKGYRMGDGSHKVFDTCVPALVISNSEVGSGSLSVESGMLTKACTNLAFFSQDSMKRRHVGARHDLVAGESVTELLSDATRHQTDKALWMQVRDIARAAFNELRFSQNIERVTATTAHKIEGDPVQVVSFAAKHFGLTEGEGRGVLRHLIEGGDLTQYGLFNAITRTGQDIDSYDRATEFERLGGRVIDLAPHEWSLISKAEEPAQRRRARVAA